MLVIATFIQDMEKIQHAKVNTCALDTVERIKSIYDLIDNMVVAKLISVNKKYILQTMPSCKKFQKKLQSVARCQKSVNFKNIYNTYFSRRWRRDIPYNKQNLILIFLMCHLWRARQSEKTLGWPTLIWNAFFIWKKKIL